MIAFLVLSCLLWIFPTRNFSEPNFVLKCIVRYGLLIVPALLSRIIILHNSKRFQYDKLPRVYYSNTVGEKENYFEVRLKNGDVLNSKVKFFYPVSRKDGILLLFLDGTSLTIDNDSLLDSSNPVFVCSPFSSGET